MEIVFARQPRPATITRSVFLAGPSPRNGEGENWRLEALHWLKEQGFTGTVFVPLDEDGQFREEYWGDQVEWERDMLDTADAVVFWVPRAQKLPGLTTNVEFGSLMDSGRVFYGRPDDAISTRYLDAMAARYGVDVHNELEPLLAAAVGELGEGEARTGGERDVPLLIWHMPAFQAWYKAQRAVYNELRRARLLWNFRPRFGRPPVVRFALHVHVYVHDEDREKTNEFVFGRPDISVVVPYYKDDAGDVYVPLVREFRSPARNSECFVYEPPGGSGAGTCEALAASEFKEETGVEVSPKQLLYMGKKQVAATLSTYQAYLYRLQLTKEQFAALMSIAESGEAHGVEEDTERTYVEIFTYEGVFTNQVVDWASAGMVATALQEIAR